MADEQFLIQWLEDDDRYPTSEAPGVIVYGLWKTDDPGIITFPAGAWPTRIDHGSAYPIGDSDWCVLLWDVRVYEWPKGDQWFAAVKGTLEGLLDQGAAVAEI